MTEYVNLELEANIPVWVDFVSHPQYGTKPYEGKTKSGKNPGSPYWRYNVSQDGVEKGWTIWEGQKDLHLALQQILPRTRRVALMLFIEDKKHYICVSDPLGSLMTCVPNFEIPQRFVDFVQVAPSNPTMGGGATPQQPQTSPSVSPKRAMLDCMGEAFDVWYEILVYASRKRFEVEDARKTDAEMAFLAFQQAMASGLAQTAHTLFINGNSR